ncbi:radical SAM protein [Candidatus Bathyarchaeota archaeon]|nr:radical SAM protein [Candidatus Bathyarchaeota archaeon]
MTSLKPVETSQVFHILKPLNSFKPEVDYSDELHIAANTYKGCPYKCTYCYIYGYIRSLYVENPSSKKLFRRRFKRDLEALGKLNLSKHIVYMSPSCEPLSSDLEKKYGNTLYALKSLREYGFINVVILTKNPSLLLKLDYLEALNRKNVQIEVSIPLLDSRFEGYAPSPYNRMDAVFDLIKEGFIVYLRVEPVIPSFGSIVGQSRNEFETLISEAKKAGVRRVISRCLLLPVGVCKTFPAFYKELKPYYKQYGYRSGTYYILDHRVRLKLIKPLYDACRSHGVELWIYSNTAFKHPTFIQADNIYLPSRDNIL